MNRTLALSLKRVTLVLAIFAVWELATGGFGLGIVLVVPAILPRPSSALAEIVPYSQSGLLWRDLSTTLTESMVRLIFGMIGGCALGLLPRHRPRAAAVLEPAPVSLNSVP